MPELRKRATSPGWVIIATERSKRPQDFRVPPEERRGAADCPFCYGHEEQTPPEVLALGRDRGGPDTPGWSVRVVPNKFPALTHSPGERLPLALGRSLFQRLPGIGAHEVLVESPRHESTFGSHTQEQMEIILEALLRRLAELKRDENLVYPQFFKNQGRSAGASLEHAHCQIIVTPVVPPEVEEEVLFAGDYHTREHGCVYCDLIRVEMERGERVVEENDSYLAFCPWASSFPYETWIVPKRHAAAFESIAGSTDEIADLARLLRHAVRRLEISFASLPYNLMLHTAPWRGVDGPMAQSVYHWHLELAPRLAIAAGFEFGTGIYINPTAPEAAASALRSVVLEPEVTLSRF